MNKYLEYLQKKAEEFNFDLSGSQLDLFKKYWEILYEYNCHTNLVSSAEPEEVFVKHFTDSLSIGLLKTDLSWENDVKIIDIGIGGGFPGIPILIANPHARLCGVESVGKKVKFLEYLVKELGISNRAEFFNGRVEELASDPEKREEFDIAVTRAVAQLNVISEYCLPFVKPGGAFVAYKAKNIEDEILQAKAALSILGGKFENTVKYSISTGEEFERTLVLINKIKKTPSKYPRKTGIPKKSPL